VIFIKNNINEVIKKTVSEVLLQLKIDNLPKQKNTFQKTEQLLYNFKNFKESLIEKEKRIAEIKKQGYIPEQNRSKDIIFFTVRGSNIDELSFDEQLEILERSMLKTKRYIEIIEDALNKIKDDKYYNIIEMKYFNKLTREQIAEYFNVDVATISRNKNRLVNIIRIYLFSDEVICEFFM
jgi:RNA polymerase sigma factor (sigma-70 family)